MSQDDSWAWLFVLLLGVVIRKGKGKAPAATPAAPPRRDPTPQLAASSSWAPIPGRVVAERALAQRGRGHYHMGGGAIFTAPDVYAPDGNNHPGATDCTGLLAYAAQYRKGPYNTDAIVDDAKGDQRRFYIVPEEEPVRPGDFLITDKGKDVQDHAGVIVDVLPGFVRHGPEWWKFLRVAQAAGESWETSSHENVEDRTGAVRVTDAYRWRHAGVIVRAHHVTE